eukprot:GHVU01130227.1.p1 GENE.GHVU01130227.1~~GHVU01130227.1.p1  ORF type:complete len:196 (-),score=23.98 GHVU01130227.1:48-635(-)
MMIPARGHPICQYSHSVSLGHTEKSLRDVLRTYARYRFSEAWSLHTYDVFTHNCINFADAFSLELGTRPCPQAVTALPYSLQSTLQQCQTYVQPLLDSAVSLMSSSLQSLSTMLPPPTFPSALRSWGGSSALADASAASSGPSRAPATVSSADAPPTGRESRRGGTDDDGGPSSAKTRVCREDPCYDVSPLPDVE